MADLIHHVSWLPYKGKDPATISEGKGNDLALAKAMKTKYKLVKKKRGYAISNIKEKRYVYQPKPWLTKLCKSVTPMRYWHQWSHWPSNACRGSSLICLNSSTHNF